jgi:hypothetical protein
MAAVNKRRVLLGTIVGGAVWAVWSWVVNGVLLASQYAAAQTLGQLLKQPRYPLFLVYWFVTIFLLSYILTWIYVSVRGTFGPGPGTALRVGFLAGFMMGFPVNLSLAGWATFDRMIALGWMADLWLGAVLATFVSAWLYKE